MPDLEGLAPSLEDPALELERVNGYTGEFTRSLLFSPGYDEIVYACNNLVVAMTVDGSRQRCLPAPGLSNTVPSFWALP